MSKKAARAEDYLPADVLRFHMLLNAASRRSQELSSAVALQGFAQSWAHACQLTFELLHAEAALRMLPAPHYPRAEQRLGAIRSIVVPLLNAAPMPSVEALREVQSCSWQAPRPEWWRCEAAWIACRGLPSGGRASPRRRAVPETIPEPFSSLGALPRAEVSGGERDQLATVGPTTNALRDEDVSDGVVTVKLQTGRD